VADRSIDLDRIFCCWLLLIQNSLLLAGVQMFLGSKLETPLSYVGTRRQSARQKYQQYQPLLEGADSRATATLPLQARYGGLDGR
jgi:hypothetical protein